MQDRSSITVPSNLLVARVHYLCLEVTASETMYSGVLVCASIIGLQRSPNCRTIVLIIERLFCGNRNHFFKVLNNIAMAIASGMRHPRQRYISSQPNMPDAATTDRKPQFSIKPLHSQLYALPSGYATNSSRSFPHTISMTSIGCVPLLLATSNAL